MGAPTGIQRPACMCSSTCVFTAAGPREQAHAALGMGVDPVLIGTCTFSDFNYTFVTSCNSSVLGSVGCGAITSSGNLAITGTITCDT